MNRKEAIKTLSELSEYIAKEKKDYLPIAKTIHLSINNENDILSAIDIAIKSINMLEQNWDKTYPKNN